MYMATIYGWFIVNRYETPPETRGTFSSHSSVINEKEDAEVF